MALDRVEIIDFLCASVVEILEAAGEKQASPIMETTGLLGSTLSSLMLVELMLAVEDFCMERGYQFSWTDDSAMSERRSVYRSIASLADFMQSLPVKS